MQDDLDKLIDGALSTYSTAEPLAGLEQRVLGKVRAAAASRKRRWWWAALAVAAPALAAILFFAAPVRQPAIDAPIAVVAPPPAPPIAPTPPTARPSAAAPKPRRAAPRRELPKEDLFPKIAPLTREESLVVLLAESRPQMLLARPADAIAIKPLEIAPLNLDGNHEGVEK